MLLEQPTVKDDFFEVNDATSFKSFMSRIINKGHKHFRRIVFFFTEMMNRFFCLKIPADLFLDNKTMFANIMIMIERMFGLENKNVTPINSFSTFPARVFFSSPTRLYCFYSQFIFCFFRMMLSIKMIKFSFIVTDKASLGFKIIGITSKFFITVNTIKCSIWNQFFTLAPRNYTFFSTRRASFRISMSFKFFIAINAIFHFITSIKKPLSVCLEKTVKFSHLLGAMVLGIKNPFSLSNLSIADFNIMSTRKGAKYAC